MSNQLNRKPKILRTRKRRLAQKQANALNFDHLESRQMLASVTVGNASDIISSTADTSSIAALIAADGGDGISLREAITASNNTASANTILFDPSVFNGGADSLIRLTQGELEITRTLTIDASAATDVTITGDADGDDITNAGTFITNVAASFGGAAGSANDLLDDNSRVLNFNRSFGDLMLNGLTLTGGRTTRSNPFSSVSHSGGGVSFFSTENLSVINCTISGNSTAGYQARGGGIFIEGNASFDCSTISGNSTAGDTADGGGIAISWEGTVSLSNNSTVSGNSTSGEFASGGGIAALSLSNNSWTLTDSTVSGNSTSGDRSIGGGIFTRSEITLTNSLVLENSTAGLLSSGGGIAAFGVDRQVSLAGSTVSGNSTTGEGSAGGGIHAGGILSLIDSIVSENSTAGLNSSGGGINAGSSSNAIFLTNSTVIRNTAASPGSGGGIFSAAGAVVLTNSAVIENNAGTAGGIKAGVGGVVLTNSTVSKNSTVAFNGYGGGISSTGDVHLNESTVSENNTAGSYARGGGIRSRSDVFLSNSTVSGNSTIGYTANGGGIYSGGNVSLASSTVSGNSSDGGSADGGGIFSEGNVFLTSSTISGNSTAGSNADGGGIYVAGDVSLTSSTISGNSAGRFGGGINVDNTSSNGSLSIDNSIVAGNTANSTSPDLRPDPGGTLTINHSLIGATDLTITGTSNQLGSLGSPIDPLLDSLADNGGPTLTYALLPGSPALDAGMSADAADQRGFTRDDGNGVDIGAFEAVREVGGLIVTTSSDVVNPFDNLTSLREAVDFANDQPAADTIMFDGSVFIGGTDSLIRLTQGELGITDSLIIDASAATDVTITSDADADDLLIGSTLITDVAASFGGAVGAADDLLDDNSRVLNFLSTTGSLTLNDLTLTGGRTTGDNVNQNDTSYSGGGIRFLSTGDLTLVNSSVSGNSTSGDRADGGGIRASGNVSLSNSTLSGNSTAGNFGSGGGIYVDDGISLNDSTVSENNTAGNRANGGGIYARFNASVFLIDSTVSENRTTGDNSGGGGILAYASVSLSGSTVSGNSTATNNSSGGGISANSVSLTNSFVSVNSTTGAGARGGGISVSGDVSLTNSTVSGNSTAGLSADGGGIRAGGDVTLVSSTVSGNSAEGSGAKGGGIATFAGEVSLTSSTVNGNSAADEGGGIARTFNTSLPFTIENSIVAGNTDESTSPDLLPNANATLTISHSLIGATDLAISGTGNIVGSLSSPIDPLLGPLADNGGPTRTHALLPGSPAIDAGSNALAAGLPTDQRGLDRLIDGDNDGSVTVDIGSVEFERGFLLGDVNRDNAVNFRDISPFISLLLSSTFSNEADIDGNGAVNFLDIGPFIGLLAGRGSAQSSRSISNVAISSKPSTTSKQLEVTPPNSPAVSQVPASKSEAIVAVASTVNAPILAEVPLPKNGHAATDNETAAKSQTLKTTTPVSYESIELTNDSSTSLLLQTSSPPAVSPIVTDLTPVDTYRGPVKSASVRRGSVAAHNPSFLEFKDNDRVPKQHRLKRNAELGYAEHFDLLFESREDHTMAKLPNKETFSTSAEWFDTHPESVDEIFHFGFEDILAE